MIPVSLAVVNSPEWNERKTHELKAKKNIVFSRHTEPSDGCGLPELPDPELDVRASVLPTLVCRAKFGLNGGT